MKHALVSVSRRYDGEVEDYKAEWASSLIKLCVVTLSTKHIKSLLVDKQ